MNVQLNQAVEQNAHSVCMSQPVRLIGSLSCWLAQRTPLTLIVGEMNFRLKIGLAIIVVLGCGARDSSSQENRNLADSATDALLEAERTLTNSGRFAVDYSIGPEETSGWPGVRLKGRLVMQAQKSCILTNAGGFSIIPAELTLVSDEQSYLLIHRRGVEWVSERPGPFTLPETAALIPRVGILPILANVVAGEERRNRPSRAHKNRPLQLSSESVTISNRQELGLEELPTGVARHIQFDVAIGTNRAHMVDLWVDKNSGLPVRRRFLEPGSGDVLTETYAFQLRPALSLEGFDPRAWARRMKVEGAVIAADKPVAKLLRGALWGDESLVRQALQSGADANSRTDRFTGEPGGELSALMLASISGNLNVVKVLLQFGAEPNARAPSGATPLDFAESRNNSDVVAWLRSNGAEKGERRP